MREAAKMNKKVSWLLLLLMCIVTVLFPIQSFAHAYVISSNPSENAVLKEPPKQIRIQFSESIQTGFHSITLVNSSGKKVATTSSKIDPHNGSILEVNIKGKVSKDTYTVQWKAISADGHPVQGVIPFNVGTGKGSVQAEAKTSGYVPQADMIILRVLLYISFALFIGIIMFNLLIQQQYSQKMKQRSIKGIWIAWIGMTIAILLDLPLQTTINANVSWLHAFQPSLLIKTLTETSFGIIWLIQLALLVALFGTNYLSTIVRNQFSLKSWMETLIVFIGLLITKSITSHATSSNHEWLGMAMDFLHLLFASIWVGGLIAIFLLSPSNASAPKDEKMWYLHAVQRFSILAFIAVAVIIITGIYGSLAYIPTWYALFHTVYGKTLIVKIVLFFFMLGMGAYHFIKGSRKGRNIRRTVLFEFVVGVLVMVAVSVLTNLPTAMSAPGPFSQTKQVQQHQVTLQVSPNVEGMNEFKVRLKDKNGHRITNVAQVTLKFEHSTMNMNATTMIIPEKSSGVYEKKGLYLNMAGQWKITVHVLTKSLDSYDAQFQAVVGSQ